jgi:uncharacterized repeat protein (TIGR03847 family)
MPCYPWAGLAGEQATRRRRQQLAEHTEFGPVARLEADAVGPPGRRSFRLLVGREGSSAWLWVEREQLQALAMLIEQLLTGLPALDLRASASQRQARPAKRERGPTIAPDVEFKVGQLALGYDQSQKLYLLLVHELESDPEGPARFSCQATRQQLRSLGESIAPLLVAGRPRCAMCEAPLGDDKHVCPRANGHAARAAED